MKQILLKETVIMSVSKNTFREITVKMKLHPSDYTPELEEQLYSLRENGEPLVVAIMPSGYIPPTDDKNNRLAFLHKCMLRYSDITGTSIETLVADIYKRYVVRTRKDLTPDQIETEIQFFTSI
jgi:hypothetical protein